MNYCPIFQTVALSAEYRCASLVQRGIWTNLMFHCAGVENYGRIKGFGRWSARKVSQVLDVPLAKVRAGCELWAMDGEDLVVFGYPVAAQASLEYKRRVLADTLNRKRVLAEAEGHADVEAEAAREMDSSDPGCVEQLRLMPEARLVSGDVGDAAVPVDGRGEDAGGEVAVVVVDCPVVGAEADFVEGQAVAVAVDPVVAGAGDGVWYAGIGRLLSIDELEGVLGKRPSVSEDVDGFMVWSGLAEDVQRVAYPEVVRAEAARVDMAAEAEAARRGVMEAARSEEGEAMEVFRRFAGRDYGAMVRCVNLLMPGWRKLAQLSSYEGCALRDVLGNLQCLSVEDWGRLWRFYRKFGGRKESGFWAPPSRQRFLECFVDVYGHCLRWGR